MCFMTTLTIPTPSVTVAPLGEDVRRKMLYKMLQIRFTEEKLQELFLANVIRGTTHLCDGQEGVSTGVAAALQEGDSVTCTYRGHGHALAMGMSIKSLMAEMMGKVSGCCRGKGGSMHLTDANIGLLGANAIVGAQLPIALGAALTAQIRKTGNIAVAFFGEGAANIGTFHETLNLAAVWKLPVIFVCENNRYGEYSAQHITTSVEDIAVRAVAYGIPGIVVDGQDSEVVYAEFKAAAQRAREGKGPSLLEMKTYRYRGHSRTDTAPYRPAGELEAWQQRDPIKILTRKMFADGQLDQTEFEELAQSVRREVVEAVEWAQQEPYPSIEELTSDIFYEG
jgi:pyruvate dehydrogenase E1 component alpha subunit